jgi:hypothetical protein
MIRSAEGRLRSVFTFPRFHSLSFVNLRRDLPFAPSNQRRDLLRESYSIPKDNPTQVYERWGVPGFVIGSFWHRDTTISHLTTLY